MTKNGSDSSFIEATMNELNRKRGDTFYSPLENRLD